MEVKNLVLIIAVTIAVLSSTCSCVEINHIIPAPIQCLFRSKNGQYGRIHCNKKQENEKEEHGSLDFFGRDLIRKITGKSSNSEEERVIPFSNATTGLDCDKQYGKEVNNFKSKIQVIYPGTKWCGDGTTSDSYYDLGKYFLTDSCCREHDLCPDNIDKDKTKYGLVNTGLFTRSHCECDRKFYECLKSADTFLSKAIGFTYFSVLGPQCFKQDYRIISCLKTERGKCVNYRQDTSGEKIYQWFDSPKF